MTCSVVRSTGKVSATSNPDSVAGSFAALPAVGNHIIVKCWGSDDDAAFDFGATAVTDNQGNTYARDVHPATAQIAASGFYHNCAIFSCKVGTSAGTFTVTANPAGAGSFGAILFEAEEVSGLDPTTWFDVGASAAGNTNAPATGNTASTANADSYQAAVLVCAEAGGDAIFTSITVEAVSPAWTQRAEELDGDTYEGGEADSRILTTTGAKSCSWATVNTGNAYWVCATGVYQGATAGGTTTTKTLSDTLTLADAALHVSLRARQASDSLTVVDSVVKWRRLVRVLQDTIDVLDGFSRTVTGAGIVYAKVMSDVTTLVDDNGQRWVLRNSRLTDAIGLSDQLLRALARIRILGENLEFSDGAIRFLRAVRVPTDSLDIADELIRSYFADQIFNVALVFGHREEMRMSHYDLMDFSAQEPSLRFGGQ